MRILLVEPSRTVRALQRSALLETGEHAIEEAGDVQSGVAAAGSFGPDVIVVDQRIFEIKPEMFRAFGLVITTGADLERLFTPEIIRRRIEEAGRVRLAA